MQIDGFWGAVGVRRAPSRIVAADYEASGTTVTVQISHIIQNPGQPGGRRVDLNQVLSLFVLEPTSFARLKVDNIRVICGHVVQRGCGIQPP